MSKISILTKENGYTITNKLSKNEKINAREFEIIKKNDIKSFFTLDYDDKRKNLLSCDVSGCMSLQRYLLKPIKRESFFSMIQQLIEIIKSCGSLAMRFENIEFETSYIFIDVKTSELRMIYWPLVNFQATTDITSLLNEICFRANLENDNGLISEFHSFVKNAIPFSINSFERYISKQMENEKNAESAPKENLKKQIEKEAINKDNKIAYVPNYNLNKSDESIKDITKSSASMENAAKPSSNIKSMVYSEGTVFLGIDASNTTNAYLIRSLNNQKVLIDKPIFVIGRSKELPDYSILDNKGISRIHAKILIENNHYYIIDNNSTNKTSVNGMVLEPNQKFELLNRADIKFANEHFTFVIEE